MPDPLFTKEQLADYVKQRGYEADIDNWYDWYLKTEFTYVHGKCRIKLKVWKADINMKLRNGSFKSRKIGGENKLTECRLKRMRG